MPMGLRTRACRLAATAVLSLCGAGMPSGARADQSMPAYLLGAGDRVVVTVFGQPDFTGELPVDGDGDVTLPLVGPVHVEGFTTGQAQHVIQDRLTDGYLVRPVVTLRLGELRPVSVLGAVRSPGAYPFHFGTAVIGAIAAAGGFAASDPMQRQAVAEALAADERLQQLMFEQAALLVRQARLQAQVSRLETFAAPELKEPLPEGSMARLLTAERDAMASQLQTVQKTEELLHAQRPRLERELSAITSEMQSAKSRLELIHAEAERSDSLVKQGIGTRGAAVQFKLTESTEELNVWRLTAESFRLERELGEIDVRVQTEESAMRKEAAAELRATRARLAELDVLIPAVHVQRDWRVQQSGGLFDLKAAHRISISRVRQGVVRTAEARETTLLEPGDVIEVTSARASGQPLLSATQ